MRPVVLSIVLLPASFLTGGAPCTPPGSLRSVGPVAHSAPLALAGGPVAESPSFHFAQDGQKLVDGSTRLTVDPELAEWVEGPQQPTPAQTVIDFTAVGKDGQPVVDLTSKEVTIKVGGRQRDITIFQLLRAEGAAALAPPPVPPPFATNAVPETMGRDVLVIIDEESISAGKQRVAQDAVRDFMTGLGRADRVALLSLRQGGPNINLTDTRVDLDEALRRFSASAPAVANDEQCRTLKALQMLQSLFGGYSGRYRPAIALISGGIAPPAAGGRGYATMGSGQCTLTLDRFHDAGFAGRSLQADAYVIYAPELTASAAPEQSRSSGLETLAGVMGAEFVQAARTTDAMTRIARETSAHYIVGYEPEPNERPGVRQPVELTVSRENVKVRFRTEIVTTGAAATGSRKAGRPDDMLRAGDRYRELPLQAAAFPSRTDDGKIRLVVVFESSDPEAKLSGAAIGLYDAKGRLTRWSAEKTDLGRSPVTAGIIVSAGNYRMRVAAVDAAGRAGTVDTDVSANVVDAPPVKLSGMVLGVSDASGTFSPRLQFSGEPGAFGYLEIYNVPKGATVKVVQEIAPTADGEALASNEVPLTAGATDDARVAYSGFAIEKLPPGDVVMRALVTVNGTLVGRAMRTLRKTR